MVLLGWMAAVREDVGLLADEFLPELLLATVLLLALWLVRRLFRRDAPSNNC